MAHGFFMPYLAATFYNASNQPFSPGTPGGAVRVGFDPKPWPQIVPSLNALANNQGTPRAQAVAQVNNRVAVAPANYLFIAGFEGKS